MKIKMKDIFNNIEEIICSFALSITIVAVLVNTLLGWIIGKRFGQLEELAITGFVWTTFLGISVVYKRGSHIYIDFLVDMLPETIRKYVKISVDVSVILFCFYVVYYAYILTEGAIGKTTSLLNISYLYIDSAIVLGFAFMSIHSIRKLITDLRKWNDSGDQNDLRIQEEGA